MQLTNRWWWRILASVVVSATAAASAGESGSSLQGEKVKITLNLLVSDNEGATSRRSRWGGHPLGVGESLHSSGLPDFAFGAGGGPGGCGTSAATATVQDLFAEYGYTLGWTADARLLEASTDRLVLAASWKRFVRGQGGEPVEAAAESIPRLSLHEGDRVLLDYAIPPATDGRACGRNIVLELAADVTEDPAFAEKQIGYDLWLVHEVGGERQSTHLTRITARQGERVPFGFPKEAIQGSPPDASLNVEVRGELRGRIRGDGAIELALATERSLAYEWGTGGDGGSGVTSEQGDKALRVRPGEALRIELPAVPKAGLEHEPDRAEQLARRLAGHAFALILTAKPVS